MLSSVLSEMGYKTGTYTSPYVRYFNERMMINGQMIDNDELSEITEYVKQFADKMDDVPTEFELITAIGFEYFSRNNCDIVVLETGMGGRLDSTNIIKTPLLSVITGIALDHMSYLGDTLGKIAEEKAGIIKKGCPVVYGGAKGEPFEKVKEKAVEMGSDFFFASKEQLEDIEFSLQGCTLSNNQYKDLFVSLVGEYQPSNIATVLESISVLKNMGMEISEQAVRQGLKKAYWPARFEVINKDPLMIYDGAHNPEGLRACIDSIKRFFKNRRVNILSGVMCDKNVEEMLPVIKEVANKAFTVTPNNPRSMKSEVYAEHFKRFGIEAYSFESIEEGVREALRVSENDGCPLVSLGTLYMYGDIIDSLEKIYGDNAEK